MRTLRPRPVCAARVAHQIFQVLSVGRVSNKLSSALPPLPNADPGSPGPPCAGCGPARLRPHPEDAGGRRTRWLPRVRDLHALPGLPGGAGVSVHVRSLLPPGADGLAAPALRVRSSGSGDHGPLCPGLSLRPGAHARGPRGVRHRPRGQGRRRPGQDNDGLQATGGCLVGFVGRGGDGLLLLLLLNPTNNVRTYSWLGRDSDN